MKALFQNRLDTFSFLIRLILCLLVILLVRYAYQMVWGPVEYHPRTLWFHCMNWVISLGWTVYVLAFVMAPRLRDVGWPSWFAIFSLLPIVNLVFILCLACKRSKIVAPTTDP